MSVKSNFNKFNLLINAPIKVEYNDNIYVFHMPTIADIQENKDFYSFAGFCATADMPESLNKYDLFITIIKENTSLGIILIYYMQRYIDNFNYVDDCGWCINNTLIDSQVIDIFCEYICIACGYKPYTELVEDITIEKTEEELEWERIKKENEAKIAKAKAKKSLDPKSQTEIDVILVSLVFEYHFNLKELFNMNMYTIYFFYKYIGSLTRYRIDVIAAGTGNMKKDVEFKYFIEK